MQESIDRLRNLADEQFEAAKADLGEPGITTAVESLYRTLTVLQELYRRRAALNEAGE